jgi:hypothetical protein
LTVGGGLSGTVFVPGCEPTFAGRPRPAGWAEIPAIRSL